jgi:DNA polymerase III sliding clamp (beta) subunit (PCNA family)
MGGNIMSWIEINAATVADAMTTARKIVGTWNGHACGSTVRISHERKTTSVERTNLDASVRANMDGTSAWPSWGPVIVDAAAFVSAVGKNGTVRIVREDGSIRVVRGDASEMTVPLSSAEWPSDDAHEYVDVVSIRPWELQRVASIADVARGLRNDARAVLSSVSIDADGTVLSTDTYRAHGTRLSDSDGRATLVDGSILFVACTSADDSDVHVSSTDGTGFGKTCIAWTGAKGPKKNRRIVHYVVTSSRPEGPFPNVFRVIPTDDPSDTWTVRDASGTADVLRTFRPGRGTIPTMLNAAGSAIRATLSEDGTERSAILPIAVPDGSETVMAANADYVRDAVLHVGDGARVDTFGALRPFHFVAADDPDTFALVMPMRVS